MSPHAPWRIAVISSIVLILELTLIRQIPAEVRSIAYFTNLLLMASFFGLGVGCILEEQRSVSLTVPLGLALLAIFVFLTRGLVIYEEAASVHYWLAYDVPKGAARPVPLFLVAALAFVLGSLPFVGLGQALARAMNEHPRLVAYGWDILGSLGGTILFVLSSYLRWPPWVWPPVLMGVWVALFVRAWPGRLFHVATGLVFLAFAHTPYPYHWSPYYFVQYRPEKGGVRVWVNSSFHQFAIDFGSSRPEDQKLQQHMLHKFELPYEIYRAFHHGRSPARVLILGAGTGNDVNVALKNGVGQVVAVEIDPAIVDVGRELNSARPYSDPKVHVRVDDARHFLQSTRERFDLVLFGTLDSQTLLSGYANLRLENYVYTREAFGRVARVVNDDGVVAAYYSVFKPWFYGRLYATVREQFGGHCRLFRTSDTFLFNTVIACAGGIPVRPEDPAIVKAQMSTDDWPYLYLERPTIAPLYLKLFALILGLIVLVFVALRRIHPITRGAGPFFFLGFGFALMESAAVVRFALLFGSTWIVNAVVFAAVLATIFLANLMVYKGGAPRLAVAWAGVCGGVALNFLLPLGPLLELPEGIRVLSSGLLVGIPVYFAAVCFSRLFAGQETTGYALGVNLIGAMAGGVLEYLSMLTGMRAVWLVILAVYLLGVLMSLRQTSSRATMA